MLRFRSVFLLPTLLFVLLTRSVAAQVAESFTDGDFTQNPAWAGDTPDFIVNAAQQLQTNGAAVAATKTLAAPSRVSGAATWEFWANLKFGTSAANHADVYLTSDSASLTGQNQGYFVRLGGTPDEVSLFRKNRASSTLVIDGTDGLLASTSNNVVRVRVTRDTAGNWTLGADIAGGTTYAPQGTARDTTYAASRWFGVVARYTQSNALKFYFDDFRIIDTAPPAIRRLTVLTGTTLRLQLDEPVTSASASAAGAFTVAGVGAATSAALDPLDDAAVLLTFGTAFGNGLNTLTISGLTDLFGNALATPLTRTFRFSAPPAPVSVGDVRITELFVDTSIPVGNPLTTLPPAPFVEILNTSTQPLDLLGWRLQDAAGAAAGTSGTLRAGRLAPGQYAVLTPAADTGRYRLVVGATVRIIGVTSWPTLNITGDLVRLLPPAPATLVVDAVTYSDDWYRDAVKDDGGWSLEKINSTRPCSDGDNWLASIDMTGGTPGRLNSVNSTAPDATAPTLVRATLRNSTRVDVQFSEAIDTLTATIGRFTLTGGLSVTAVDFRPDSLRLATLALSGPLVTGTLYTLTISSVADCAGNTAATPLTATLLIGAAAGVGEVQITELFIDTSIPAGNPPTALPAAQFIEIFNSSTKYFDLNGWKLQDATAGAGTVNTGAAAYLAPGQYAVLTRTTDTTAYRTYLGATARIIGVTSWPTFNLDGDAVKLRTPAGLLIEQVNYTDDWYRDPVKAAGGWSLEKIRAVRPCSDADNWLASTDVSGGTPGRINSVNSTTPDVTPPALARATVLAPTRVEVEFTEAIDTLTATIGRFTLTGGLSVTAVDFRADSLRFVTLTLSGALVPGTRYTLTITNVADCSGNVATPPLVTTLLLGATAVAGDVRITELFVDTSVPAGNPLTLLPAAQFVEVFNGSTKTFDLSGWRVQDGTTSVGTVGAGYLAPGQYVVLTRTTDTTAYRAFLGAAVRIVGVAGLPSLNLTADRVRLLSSTGVRVDEVNYTDDWYRDPVKDDGGWSLEKINAGLPCSDAANWVASNDMNGGTPGRINSVSSSAPDVRAPTPLAVAVLSPTRLRVQFSEAIDTLTATVARFVAAPGSAVTAVDFRADSLRFVFLTLSAPLVAGTRYTLTISGVADCSGNTPATATVLSFGLGELPELYEVLITEILADESPSISLPITEYLEIHNPTARVLTLADVRLGKPGSSTVAVFAPDATLEPGEYAVVCGSTRAALFIAIGVRKIFALTNFPSLTNAADTLTLRRADGQLLFSVAYTDDWYRNPAKKDGGWALEMIDRAKPCGLAANWGASRDSTGGTPGRLNSRDSTLAALAAPALARVRVASINGTPSGLRLFFTEKLDSLTAADPARYVLGGGGPLVTAATVRGPEWREVRLTLSAPLTPGRTVPLTVTGLTGCAGATQPLTANVLVPETPRPTDVVINEILFNPRAGGVDFVEIVNRSTKQLDLDGYFLATLRDDSLYQLKALPNFALPPGSLAALTVAPDTVAAQYPASTDRARLVRVAALPSYSDDAGTVVLLAPDSTELDRYAYDERQHTPLLTNEEGVSLERIRLDGPSDPTNFHSAASTVGFATPGRVNSQSRATYDLPDNTVKIVPRVITPGQGGAEFADITYVVPGAGYTANFTIFDSQGRLIRKLARNQTLATSGTFQWQGEDDNNRRVATGYYVLYAEFFDLKGAVKVFKETVAVGSR